MEGADTLDMVINVIKDKCNVQTKNQSCLIKESNGQHQEALYELGIYSTKEDISFIRVSDLLFLNSRIKHQMQESPDEMQPLPDLIEDIKRQTIYLSQFRTSMVKPTLHFYSIITAYALANIDLKGKVVLDLGAADGIQSLVAHKRGAQRVIAVGKYDLYDEDDTYYELFAKHIFANDMDARSFLYLDQDINKKTMFSRMPKLIKHLPAGDIDAVVSNIGPHYGSTHLSVIDLAPYLPNVKHYILGGYIYPKALTAEEKQKFHTRFPCEAISRLKGYGFKVTSQFWDKEHKAMSLIAEHSE